MKVVHNSKPSSGVLIGQFRNLMRDLLDALADAEF
jgi:hypothetical protein